MDIVLAAQLLPLHFSFIDSAMLYVHVNEQPACTFP
jgi:hypothetical protein